MYKHFLNQYWKQISYGLAGLGFMSLCALTLAHSTRPTMTIATVNVTGMVNSFVKETAQQNLTMEQKQQKVDQFGKSMQHVLDDLAKERHIVIVMSEAVVAGATDMTPEIMLSIKKEMK